MRAPGFRAESQGPPCLPSGVEKVRLCRLVADNEMKRMVREDLEGIVPSSWEPLRGTVTRVRAGSWGNSSQSGSPVGNLKALL